MICDWTPLLALRQAHATRRSDLAQLLLGGADPHAICRDPAWVPTERQWRAAAQQRVAITTLGITVVPISAAPAWLLRAKPLPIALFVRGATGLLSRSAIAVVGSRGASPGNLRWAAARAVRAVQEGHVLVSGGALGIDAAAHHGALRAGGQTIAYLGNAVDRLYPARNRGLFTAILQQGGAIVSEHPPLEMTFKSDWSMRNRLIAAHAALLLVAEAAEGSGSLTTALWAERYGIPVQVAPSAVGGERGGLMKLLGRGWATGALPVD